MVNCEALERVKSNPSTLIWLLVGDIREMLQDRLDADAVRWLRPLLDTLADAMECDCDAGSDNWYTEMLEPFPEWSSQIEGMRREQRSLCRSLKTLRSHMELDLPLTTAAAELEADLSAWVGRMLDHSRRQGRLMQDVWFTETGGEG